MYYSKMHMRNLSTPPPEGLGTGGAGTLTSESVSEELELEELEESLELSEAMPVDSWRSTASARTASSGCSCFKILKGKRYGSQGCDSWWGQPLKMTDSKWRTPLLTAPGNAERIGWSGCRDNRAGQTTRLPTFAEGKLRSSATRPNEH